MKKLIFYLASVSVMFFAAACQINDPYNNFVDNTPPAPPTGIVVLNGDNQVDLSWTSNREDDLAGYNVYYSYSYNGKYTLIGSIQNPYFTDYDAVNGNKYYYAVTSYDFDGNESELSYDVVYSTPRPEGFNNAIFDYINYPDKSGYSFTTYSTVPYDDLSADFFFENYDGTYYLDVYDDTDIQDMGPTNDIYDIDYAPTSGWSDTKDEIAQIGHTYVIWTWDNHYAKVRVKNITPDRVVFDWAFQLVEGETQLKAKPADNKRKPLSRKQRK